MGTNQPAFLLLPSFHHRYLRITAERELCVNFRYATAIKLHDTRNRPLRNDTVKSYPIVFADLRFVAMEEVHQLVARDCYRDSWGRVRCSRWSSWGRWVVVGVAIFFFLLLALSCMCVARRRRKRGVSPYYGTGWMAPNGGKFGNQGAYNQGYGNNQHQMYNYNQGGAQGGYQQPYASPPAYGGQPQQDYYGGQQYGVQSPPATYQQNSYAPPPGPPPGK